MLKVFRQGSNSNIELLAHGPASFQLQTDFLVRPVSQPKKTFQEHGEGKRMYPEFNNFENLECNRKLWR